MRTYEKRCGRCGGTGIYSEYHGGCFNCGGSRGVPGSGIVTVYVYTAEEKAASKLRFERATRAYQIVREAAKALYDPKTFNMHAVIMAEAGVNELREREPERYERMLDSLDAGRIEETVMALSAYCEAGYPIWYGGQ